MQLGLSPDKCATLQLGNRDEKLIRKYFIGREQKERLAALNEADMNYYFTHLSFALYKASI